MFSIVELINPLNLQWNCLIDINTSYLPCLQFRHFKKGNEPTYEISLLVHYNKRSQSWKDVLWPNYGCHVPTASFCLLQAIPTVAQQSSREKNEARGEQLPVSWQAFTSSVTKVTSSHNQQCSSVKYSIVKPYWLDVIVSLVMSLHHYQSQKKWCKLPFQPWVSCGLSASCWQPWPNVTQYIHCRTGN